MTARITYVARFVYWLYVHGSWSSARFCTEHEGHTWPR